MKKQIKISVNGTSYPMHFGYGANRRLGSYLGIDSYDGTVQKVIDVINQMSTQEKDGGKLPFETMDAIGYMVVSAIPKDAELEMEDVVDVLFQDMELIKKIFDAWADAMPRTKVVPNEKKTTAKTRKN